jgi:hypothetical protein
MKSPDNGNTVCNRGARDMYTSSDKQLCGREAEKERCKERRSEEREKERKRKREER